MSSRGTISSSFGQMYCCFTRVPHVLWTMLKEIRDLDSAVAYSFTGNETNPNEIVDVAMGRAAI